MSRSSMTRAEAVRCRRLDAREEMTAEALLCAELGQVAARRKALRKHLCAFVRENSNLLHDHPEAEVWRRKIRLGWFGSDVSDGKLHELVQHITAMPGETEGGGGRER